MPSPATKPKIDVTAEAIGIADLCSMTAHSIEERRPLDTTATVLRRAAQTIHALVADPSVIERIELDAARDRIARARRKSGDHDH